MMPIKGISLENLAAGWRRHESRYLFFISRHNSSYRPETGRDVQKQVQRQVISLTDKPIRSPVS